MIGDELSIQPNQIDTKNTTQVQKAAGPMKPPAPTETKGADTVELSTQGESGEPIDELVSRISSNANASMYSHENLNQESVFSLLV